MDKMLAVPVENKNGKWNVEVKIGKNKKAMIGEDLGGVIIRFCEWDTKEDAIKYIKSKDRLELKQ